jgi:hypothetical protein
MFGLPITDDGTRTDALLGQNMISCTHYEPDVAALRAAPTRIVLAAGSESDGELAHRGAEAVADRLGTAPIVFPSGMAVLWAASTVRRASPTLSPRKLREVLERTP